MNGHRKTFLHDLTNTNVYPLLMSEADLAGHRHSSFVRFLCATVRSAMARLSSRRGDRLSVPLSDTLLCQTDAR